MTPYVCLQQEAIPVLRKIKENNPGFLKFILAQARIVGHTGLTDEVVKSLRARGLHIPDENWAYVELPGLIEGLVSDEGGGITVRNILGTPFHDYGRSCGFEEYHKHRGTGDNHLRTDRLSQPRALKVGDILATGDRVLTEPREGGNGSVLIHLTGGLEGHWISVPARIPIALLTAADDVPADYVDK